MRESKKGGSWRTDFRWSQKGASGRALAASVFRKKLGHEPKFKIMVSGVYLIFHSHRPSHHFMMLNVSSSPPHQEQKQCTTLFTQSANICTMNKSPPFTLRHFGLVTNLLLFVLLINGVRASNSMNPIALGIRSALATRTHGRCMNGSSRVRDYQNQCNGGIQGEIKTFNTRSRRTCLKKSSAINMSSTKAERQKKGVLNMTRGGGPTPALSFFENMVCGAISRSIAQVATHPANTMKTLLQSNRGSGNPITIQTLAKPENMKMLTRGAGAQFIMSIPHGAVNFAVLEYVRRRMYNLAMKSTWASEKSKQSAAFGPVLDFMSSAVATVCCSVISTPQMMVVDNIMAGTYSNFPNAIVGLTKDKGIAGFYGGWWPGLVGKIPSYVSLT